MPRRRGGVQPLGTFGEGGFAAFFDVREVQQYGGHATKRVVVLTVLLAIAVTEDLETEVG